MVVAVTLPVLFWIWRPGIAHWTDIAAAGLPGVLALSLIWCVLAAWRRWRVTLACAVLVLVGSLWALDARRLLPLGGEADFRVMAFNSRATNDDVGAVEDELLDSGADIVVVCEPHREVFELAMDASSALRAGFPHAVNGLGDAPMRGRLLLLSRWPFEMITPVDEGKGVRGGIIGARVFAPDGEIVVFGLHASSPRSRGRWVYGTALTERAANMVRDARALTDRIVVLGDLNATPGMERDRIIRGAGVRRAKRLLAPAGTFPVERVWPAKLPIDGVWVGPGLRVTDWRLGEAAGSDHQPVIAGLRIAK